MESGPREAQVMTRETKAQRHRRLAKALTEHLALVESGEGEPLAGLPSDMTAEEFEDFLHKTTMRRRARSRRLFPSLLTGQRLVRDNDAG
jgi:hypothetical protein